MTKKLKKSEDLIKHLYEHEREKIQIKMSPIKNKKLLTNHTDLKLFKFLIQTVKNNIIEYYPKMYLKIIKGPDIKNIRSMIREYLDDIEIYIEIIFNKEEKTSEFLNSNIDIRSMYILEYNQGIEKRKIRVYIYNVKYMNDIFNKNISLLIENMIEAYITATEDILKIHELDYKKLETYIKSKEDFINLVKSNITSELNNKYLNANSLH